jgi:hypothetical protein
MARRARVLVSNIIVLVLINNPLQHSSVDGIEVLLDHQLRRQAKATNDKARLLERRPEVRVATIPATTSEFQSD